MVVIADAFLVCEASSHLRSSWLRRVRIDATTNSSSVAGIEKRRISSWGTTARPTDGRRESFGVVVPSCLKNAFSTVVPGRLDCRCLFCRGNGSASFFVAARSDVSEPPDAATGPGVENSEKLAKTLKNLVKTINKLITICEFGEC